MGFNLKPGARVQVNRPWSDCTPEDKQLRWVSGYEFVRLEGGTAVVKITTGTATGCETKYPIEKVRIHSYIRGSFGRLPK